MDVLDHDIWVDWSILSGEFSETTTLKVCFRVQVSDTTHPKADFWGGFQA